MSNATNKLYGAAIAWIASNDGPGDEDALDVKYVAGQLTVLMAADVFGKMPVTIARAVVAYRREAERPTRSGPQEMSGGMTLAMRHYDAKGRHRPGCECSAGCRCDQPQDNPLMPQVEQDGWCNCPCPSQLEYLKWRAPVRR